MTYDDWKSRDRQAEDAEPEEPDTSLSPALKRRVTFRKKVLEVLEACTSRCMDDEDDRKALATALTDALLDFKP